VKRQPDNPHDLAHVYYKCEFCEYVVPHPSILRSIPWCPRCVATGSKETSVTKEDDPAHSSDRPSLARERQARDAVRAGAARWGGLPDGARGRRGRVCVRGQVAAGAGGHCAIRRAQRRLQLSQAGEGRAMRMQDLVAGAIGVGLATWWNWGDPHWSFWFGYLPYWFGWN
jgi:hypothetical protein